ncbi:hypothetical protein ScalyP_jg9210 [Parmales sp. scaly parma]|nr:hypothetical protein ScalyP_jg9210 [Parmales sp. scaly parma]
MVSYETCPSHAAFLGFFSAAVCMILSNLGAAYGTYRSAIGICHLSIRHPGGIVKNLLAIIMSGVLGIYGLIVSIIIAGAVLSPLNNGQNMYTEFTGWAHVAAGLCCGLCCLAAGFATGVAGEFGVKAVGIRAAGNFQAARQGRFGSGDDEENEGDASKIYIASVTILSFAGAIGLYGFIVALIIVSSDTVYCIDQSQ